MPTTLGQPFSLDWKGAPPHMLAPDVPVWYRFLDQVRAQVQHVYLDALLGGPFLTDQEEQDPLKKSWRYVNSKRPDAIIETPDEVWIIEVSAHPGLRAIGQCLTYLCLWIEDPVITKPERTLLVIETIDTDLGAACAKFGVLIYVV